MKVEDIRFEERICNYLCMIDVQHLDGIRPVCISDYANDDNMPEDIVKMNLIYCFIFYQHGFEMRRYMECNNPQGALQFIEDAGKSLCERLGYTLYTRKEVYDVVDKYSENYIRNVFYEHRDENILINLYNGIDSKFRIEKINGDSIILRSVLNKKVIDLNDLKKDSPYLPYMTLSFGF